MTHSNEPGFIPPHGNYRELLSYQKAEVVYDITFRFCQRFLSKGDRTIDQMGKQRTISPIFGSYRTYRTHTSC
jgi:hypothetical protein